MSNTITTNEFKITPELIASINEGLNHGLVKGLGEPEPGKNVCRSIDM